MTGTRATLEDSLSTKDILKYIFAQKMGIHIDKLPDQYKNKAFCAFASADAEIGTAQKRITEARDMLEQVERLEAGLLALAKDEPPVQSDIQFHINQLKSQSAQLTVSANEVKLLEQTIPSFKAEIEKVEKPAKTVDVSLMVRDSKKEVLNKIKDRCKQVRTLRQHIQSSYDVIITYDNDFRSKKLSKSRVSAEVTPEQKPDQPARGS